MRVIKGMMYLSLLSTLAFGQLFINEIDYDQTGDDTGEFVEIAGPAGTYSNVTLDHYNGNGGALIWTYPLPEFTLSDESGGFGFYVFGVAGVPNLDFEFSGSIQNGPPDGLELKVNGIIVDAIAWEGEMTDSEGNPMESMTGDFSGIDSSASRTGMDNSPWEYGPYSPGEVNTNQTFDPNASFDPIANAGADQSVESGVTVTLDGSASSDADGSIVSYLWTQVSGSAVSITDASTAIASFVVPTVTETSSWVFSLLVTDDEGATGSDETTITVSISAAMTIAEARTQPEGTLITITGLINSGNLSGSGSDYTIQDETAGINMYLSGIPVALELGDEVTVTGVTEDYSGKYEVKPASETDIVVNSSGNTLESQVITAAELASNGETYESELITILGVSNEGSGDPWPALESDANINITDNGSDVTVMRIDKETEIDGSTEPVWPMDVVGVVSEFNGTYQIMPRMLSDFLSNIVTPTFADESHTPAFVTAQNDILVYIDIIPGDEEQTIESANILYGTSGLLNTTPMGIESGNTWVGVIPGQAANTFLEYEIIATAITNYDTGLDTSDFDSYTYELAIASSILEDISAIQADPVIGDVVTIEGIVTIGAGLLQTGLTKAYMQDGSGHGINLFQYDELPLNRGDMIKVVGVVDVYTSTVEIKDFSYQLISTGNELPAPVILTPAEANATLWEGTLIKVTGQVTESYSAGGGQNISITDGSETTLIRIWESTGVDVTALIVGTDWSFMGVESQYNGTFQMLVAYAEDIVSTSAIDVLDGKPHHFALNPAYPNPFNPSTTLSWNLEETSEFSLRVLDIRGREVAQLAEGTSSPGHFTMAWDASALSSGVYFVQLSTPSEQSIQKVMLLK